LDGVASLHCGVRQSDRNCGALKESDTMSRESQHALSPNRAAPDVRCFKAENLIVPVEDRWRCPPPSADRAVMADRIVAASWGQCAGEPAEVSCPRHERYYTVGISLTAATVTFEHDGKIICDGPVMPGSIQITAPGESVKAYYASPCRVMHLFFTPDLLTRRYDEADGLLARPCGLVQSPGIFRDVAVERLALALEAANPLADAFGRVFADSVCDAIVARLLGRRTEGTLARMAQRSAQLPKWRLRRAIDFIEANLDGPIGLADMAASAGLTRMHFAAQFRSTTGYSPHAYLLQRRLEHAQMLLRNYDFSVLDVALSCGFSSHSHFTAVFKRMIGDPPTAWRVRMRSSGEAVAAKVTALGRIASL
jgi:AraC family transcriptional regulator